MGNREHAHALENVVMTTLWDRKAIAPELGKGIVSASLMVVVMVLRRAGLKVKCFFNVSQTQGNT
jgi:hypothetical protein